MSKRGRADGDASGPPGKKPSVEGHAQVQDVQHFRAFMGRISRHSFSGKTAATRVTRVTNVRLLRGHKLIKEDLWIRAGKVIDPMSRFWEAHSAQEYMADQTIDGGGCIVAPGFIDVQINGAFGIDFSAMDLTQEDVTFVSRKLLQHGVTAFCPTMVSSKAAAYKRNLPLLGQTLSSVEAGAASLGAHCEGPFISKEKFGAHETCNIVTVSAGVKAIAKTYGQTDNVRVVTIAPELKGAVPAIRELHKRGIVVSMGHTLATVEQAEAGIDAGATCVTHMFNAMQAFHHRDPGLVGLLGSPKKGGVFYTIIVDDIHSHDYSVAIAYKSHPAGLVLITDAMAAMGLGDGKHKLGDKTVAVANGMAQIDGTDTLAGSVCSMDSCVRNFARASECSVPEALEAASLHPAQMLGIDGVKGSLSFGCDADFVMLDDELNVLKTFVGGNLAWSKKE